MDQTLFLENSRAARTLYKLSSLFIILLLSLLFGCANHAARNEELLAIDYQNLSNDELSLYYYDLQDQIDIVERRSSVPRLSLGLGLSSFGGSSSGGGGSFDRHQGQPGSRRFA